MYVCMYVCRIQFHIYQSIYLSIYLSSNLNLFKTVNYNGVLIFVLRSIKDVSFILAILLS